MSTTNTSDTVTAAGTVSAGPGVEPVVITLTQPDSTIQTSTVNTAFDATVTTQEDFPVSFTVTQNGTYTVVGSVAQVGNFAASTSAPQTFTVSDITLTPRTVTIGTVAVS
jgi:hypothetical protein